jgi:hypothetical protein
MSNDWGAPQNELESSLMSAATDAAARPMFYKVLANAKVLIVPVGEMPTIVDDVVREPGKLQLAKVAIQGQLHIPLFSSEARLPQDTRYLGLAAADLFKMTQGEHLVLNPGAEYGKVLMPGEIARILDGSIFNPTETFTVKEPTKAMIGQPKDYPTEFVAALKRYFATEPLVEKAFLAQHLIVGVHNEPALLVSILAPEEEFSRIAGAVGVIAQSTKKAQKAVDIVQFDDRTTSYFANQEPIYSRKKAGLLGKLFR